jgi:hypothetical protein
MAPLLASHRIPVYNKGMGSHLLSFSWPSSEIYNPGEMHACSRTTKQRLGPVGMNPSKLRTDWAPPDSGTHLASDCYLWRQASITSRFLLHQSPTQCLGHQQHRLHEYRPLSLSERNSELSPYLRKLLIMMRCHAHRRVVSTYHCDL